MTNKKLHDLREVMMKQGFEGFIIPRTDAYLGEYVPECAERLQWLTGFTGSAGFAVVLQSRAVVMSDGRYTIQLADQVDQDSYELGNSQTQKLSDWLKEADVPEGGVIGYDPRLHTSGEISALEEAGFILKAVTQNLVDAVWADRPCAPSTPVTLFPEKYAGVSAQKKIQNLQGEIKKEGADAVLLTMSDSIAWLLNIRGNDIPFIPVCLSYALVPVAGKVQWFVDVNKIDEGVKNTLKEHVEFFDEDQIESHLKNNNKIWMDEKRSSVYFKNSLQENNVEVLDKEDPCLLPRACKNESEITAMKTAHIRDGVAFVKFQKWLEENWDKGITEIGVEKKLEEFRAEAPEFKEPSFSTIAGYGAHGAIVHYRATDESDVSIGADSILLLDSGAQYEDGTTDITRNFHFGEVSDEMKEDYTLVLKGHIALARAVFKKGALGKDIDVLARGALQEKGKDYAHGTGHGVGCYLSVHEESAGINPRGERALAAGMILSNEPGFYKEGSHGIRIENLVLVKEHDDKSLCFETITLVPKSVNLIDKALLNDEELQWLNDYHASVYETLAPLLDEGHQEWLMGVTGVL